MTPYETSIAMNTMNTTEQQLQKLAQHAKALHLSKAEKDAQRAHLLSYADMHETKAPPRTAILSPFPYVSSFSMRVTSRALVVASLVIVLVAGGAGVTFAAQNTLPGQPLYAVKVDITEPLQGALIPTVEGKAEWENMLAERRLEEAAQLAANNELATSTQVYLANQVALHVKRSQEDSEALDTSGNAQAALAVRGDLEARLVARRALIADIHSRLTADGNASSTTVVALNTLLQNVTEAGDAASVDHDAAAEQLAFSATTTPATNAQVKARRATIMAYVQSEDKALHSEEKAIMTENASILSQIPVLSASSSATSTVTSATTTTIMATTTMKWPFLRTLGKNK